MNKKTVSFSLFLSLALFIGIQNSAFALVYVDIPSGGGSNSYGLQDVVDTTTGVSSYEDIPVKVLGTSNQLISVLDAGKPKLFAAIKALDVIKQSTYYYHDSNYTLGQQAGFSSQQYLLGATAIDSVGLFSPGNALTLIHSALGVIVDVSLRNYTQQLALDTASYALGKQKAFLDVAKTMVLAGEQNGYISYERLKAAYYFYLASNRMGDIAYSVFNLVINNTDVATLEAARDGGIALIPVLGTMWSNILAGADASALLADLTWALYRGALGFYSLLTDSNIFTLMEDKQGVFPKNFFFYDPINPVTGEINSVPAPTFTFSSSAIDAKVGVRIDLDGSMSLDSDGDQLSYKWSLIKPTGSLAKMINPTSSAPYFIPDVEGSYWVEMVVFDGIDTNSVGGAVDVALPVITPPNTPPVAKSTSPTSVSINTVVTLDGSNSYDPEGKNLMYQWSLIRPSGSNAVLSNTTGKTVSFTPDVFESFTAKLVVSDGVNTSIPFTQTVAVNDTRTQTFFETGRVDLINKSIAANQCGSVIQLASVTLGAGEYWDSPRLWATTYDPTLSDTGHQYFLISLNQPPSEDRGYSDSKCSLYGQTSDRGFNANFVMDMFGGTRTNSGNVTKSMEWRRLVTPGTTVYFAIGVADDYAFDIKQMTLDANVLLDKDGDGVSDSNDAFPTDPAETYDSDRDGVGNNADMFDNDPSAWQDTDGDGCPDTINGVSNTGLILDQFPTNAVLCIDADGDNVDDRINDLFPSDAAEWADNDRDGIGDNADKFDNDPAASKDTDSDGYPDSWNKGKTSADSTTGLVIDFFPSDASEWADTDLDGVGDNSDWAPNDFTEWMDTDGDGVGDNADAAPNDPARSTNVAPIIVSIPARSVVPGDVVTVNLSITDSDGDNVAIQLFNAPGFVSLSGQVISISPASSDSGEFTIIVRADDGFGGVASRQFSLSVARPDTVSPVIILNGAVPTTLSVGDIFIDPGATATDDVDGDLTANISVTGAVDTSIAGTYILTYTVSDQAGNVATIKRDVIVSPAPSAPTALLVPDKTSLETVENEFLKIMTSGGAAVDVLDAADIKASTVDLTSYNTVACFTYGAESAVSALDQTVVDVLMNAVSTGLSFITNSNACGAKVMSLAGYWDAAVANGWYPALPDSTFLTQVDSSDPLFSGVMPYIGDPQSQTVDYWTTGDHESMQFRVDSTMFYTGRYARSGQPLVPPNRYLASGFGTGFSVGQVSNAWYPEWLVGAGRIVELTSLNWTFDQATKLGGYIGVAGRQILQNIAGGVALKDVILLASATENIAENGSSVTLTVERKNASSGVVAVDYTTQDGSATASVDYQAATGTLSFADGETSKTITLNILDDAYYETDENFTLVLNNIQGGATLGSQASTEITITNDDSVPPSGELVFSSASYSVDENGASVMVTVNRINGSFGAVSVDYASADSTAVATSDYQAASGTLNFADGVSTQTFSINIQDDSVYEGNELFNLALSNVQGGASIGTQSTAQVQIIEDDAVPAAGVVQLSTATYTADEDAATVSVVLERTGGSFGSIQIGYNTINGSATAGNDYQLATGAVIFADSELQKTVGITLLGDTVYEGDETFSISLTSPDGAVGQLSTAQITLQDNDPIPPAGVLQLSGSSYTVDEDGVSVVLTVIRTNGSYGVVSVDYTTTDGTAMAGSDYQTTTGTLTFADGETTQTISVPVLDDIEFESNESFVMTLSNVQGGATLGTTPDASVMIIDNDTAPSAGVIQFSGATYSVNEGDGSVVVTLTRTNGSAGEASVMIYAEGTAQEGIDYEPLFGIFLTFADGETSQTFEVSIIDDLDVEDTETINMIASSANASVDQTAVIQIFDNDSNPEPVDNTGSSSNTDSSADSAGGGAVSVPVLLILLMWAVWLRAYPAVRRR